jgi:hypothetical protein
MQGLITVTEGLSQKSQFQRRDYNPGPSAYEVCLLLYHDVLSHINRPEQQNVIMLFTNKL